MCVYITHWYTFQFNIHSIHFSRHCRRRRRRRRLRLVSILFHECHLNACLFIWKSINRLSEMPTSCLCVRRQLWNYAEIQQVTQISVELTVLIRSWNIIFLWRRRAPTFLSLHLSFKNTFISRYPCALHRAHNSTNLKKNFGFWVDIWRTNRNKNKTEQKKDAVWWKKVKHFQ